MRSIFAALSRRVFPPTETLEGYDQPELVDVIFRKTAAYDTHRDWPEIAGASTVLDFGGGCGLHYKQARSPTVRWAVVESPAMVERAKELSTKRLQFFTSISTAASWLGQIEVIHSDGALQYTPDPADTLKQLCELKAERMLWYRLLFSSNPSREVQSSYLGDNGPGSLPRLREKIVLYDRTSISERAFLAAHDHYNLEARGPDWFAYSLT